jgi:hypothetical protein
VAVAWGLGQVSILVASFALNSTVVRVSAREVSSRITPLPLLEGSQRFGREEIEAVCSWQHAVVSKNIQSTTRVSWVVGVRKKNGGEEALMSYSTSPADAASAAELIAARLGVPAAQLSRSPGSGGVGARAVFVIGWILASPFLVYKIASLALAFRG